MKDLMIHMKSPKLYFVYEDGYTQSFPFFKDDVRFRGVRHNMKRPVLAVIHTDASGTLRNAARLALKPSGSVIIGVSTDWVVAIDIEKDTLTYCAAYEDEDGVHVEKVESIDL